jgi:hypothetical protein
MGWREMTEREVATLPEARLGGALLWMVAAALLLCIVGIVGAVFAFHQLREIGGRYTIAVGFATAWSLAFVVMTLLRVRVTPVVASVGLLAWIAYRFAAALLGQAGWPLAIDLLGEAVLAAGFCGYMASGVRPNAYYRRRLPAP